MTASKNPKLRFKDENGKDFPTLIKKNLEDICEYRNGGSFESKVTEGGNYNLITLDSIDREGNLKKIHKTVNEADWFLNKGDLIIVLSDVAHGNFLGLSDIIPENNKYVLNQRMGLLRKKDENVNLYFLKNYINFNQHYFKKKGQGSSQQNLSKKDIEKFYIILPILNEQVKIANFLTSVDNYIQNLKSQKEELEKYKKAVMQKIFSQQLRFKDANGKDFPDWTKEKLGKLCKITTGKLDANAMVKGGKYRFYTCAKDYFEIDNYAFDTEALLISGNGANVGYIHYYKGKFNAYQRTYVLDNFKSEILYIKFYLDKYLYARIESEKKAGNTPYIVMSTLSDMEIFLPSSNEQKIILKFFTNLDKNLDIKDYQIKLAVEWKKGLTQQMFI